MVRGRGLRSLLEVVKSNIEIVLEGVLTGVVRGRD